MKFRWFLVMAMVGIVILGVLGYRNARADPIVRQTRVALADWPKGARPVTIALLGDIHIGSPAMDAERLARIVAQVNARKPDLVVIAGDFVFGHDPVNGARYAARLQAPLSRLRAPLGVVAVPGNHDHWTALAAIERALRGAGITVLSNRTIARGPLAIVGVDDAFSGHADPGAALASVPPVPGARVMLSHSPDVLSLLGQRGTGLLLTAHTHCGQVILPWIGQLAERGPHDGKRLYDPRYRCSVVRDPGRTTIVTAGLGTSVAPIRWGAPPDLWLIRVGSAVNRSRSSRPCRRAGRGRGRSQTAQSR